MAHSTQQTTESVQSSDTCHDDNTARDTSDSAATGVENGDGLSKERDLEAGASSAAEPNTSKTPNLVTWDGPNDPENPKNWPDKMKWRVTVAVSLFTFISPLSSSMIAPALPAVQKDLHISSEFEVSMAMSIFVLGYAVGPLFFGPLSEMFGRARVLQASNFFYLAWNLGCGFAQNKAEIYVFRFLAGIGGSAPLSVGGGTLSDIWPAEQRGKAVGIYTLGPLFGPAVGPLAAGFIAENTTWRWVFWSTSMAAGLIQLAGLIWMKETHAPTLLKRKLQRLMKETGNTNLHTGEEPIRSVIGHFAASLVRPSRMLATQPIMQIIAVYMAYLFGITYLIAVTFPDVWSNIYGESVGIGGLNYLSLAVGSILGMMVALKVVDPIYRRLKKKNGDVGIPEFRIPAMFVGSTLIPVGLFWYGWSVQGRVHWIMPNIGIAIQAGGTIVCLQGMQGYVIDTYTQYAASGLAAAVVLRSLAGFGFPLFAPYLYKRLDYGWGSSVLAFISIGIGIPAPFLFYFLGPKLRAMSKYASG